ncbi:hypothetical protein [Acinetobacter shaoyimingii]|uniref:DUF2845 domain-containing protein n=1 Tax=Acinetobacter shaoyimingii TaxID=2715164 RepID=A0A6G8RXW1_9GAMM|nr:hypothetical protein [Acinetobacter shaoyimingii]NHB57605.1 hypothetical protein [Acinetobacter shaoyimingii]QIO06690.1 hypothetical protein G8E00_12430 [Acinetobacter shaoyimingii]
MNKLIALIFALSLSTLSYAIETTSFKTGTGQTLAIGDSLNDLIKRIAQSPDALRTVTLNHGGKERSAIIYDYSIGQVIYTITVLDERIIKIEWHNKS